MRKLESLLMGRAGSLELTSAYETARFLIVGYNCFAEENRKEVIDTEAIERSPGRKVDHFLKEWVMLSRSQALVACGEIFAWRLQLRRAGILEPPSERFRAGSRLEWYGQIMGFR